MEKKKYCLLISPVARPTSRTEYESLFTLSSMGNSKGIHLLMMKALLFFFALLQLSIESFVNFGLYSIEYDFDSV